MGPHPSSSNPCVLMINQPSGSANNFFISSSMNASQFSGPDALQVSFACPLCGNASIELPPVRKAITCVGNHSSSSGVEALKGKLKTDFFGSKPFRFFEK